MIARAERRAKATGRVSAKAMRAIKYPATGTDLSRPVVTPHSEVHGPGSDQEIAHEIARMRCQSLETFFRSTVSSFNPCPQLTSKSL